MEEAKIRSVYGTCLYGISSIAFFILALIHIYKLAINEYLSRLDFVIDLANVLFLVSIASICGMIASFRILAEWYTLVGIYMTLTAIISGALCLITVFDLRDLVSAIGGILISLLLLLPKRWHVSKFILPYYVITYNKEVTEEA